MKKKEMIDMILSIAGWMGGYFLSIFLFHEPNSLSKLLYAIWGALVYAFGRNYFEKKREKEKKRKQKKKALKMIQKTI